MNWTSWVTLNGGGTAYCGASVFINVTEEYLVCVGLGSKFDRSAWVQTQPIVLEKSADDNRLVTEDGNNTGSCFGFRVPVFCNASPFFVMCHFFHSAPTPTPNMLCNSLVHYTKKWRITNNWYLKPANWYPKPETRTSGSVINSLLVTTWRINQVSSDVTYNIRVATCTHGKQDQI